MAASGIFERGWVPSYIPRSATKIRETHNLDINIVRMTFEYERDDISEPRRHCTMKENQEATKIFTCPDGKILLHNDGSGEYNRGYE